MPPHRSGVILAGGRSTRFGERDKAVADLAGTPMIRRVADRMAPVVDDVVINCRDEQVPSIRAAMDGWKADGESAVEDPSDGESTVGDPSDGGTVTFACDPEPDLGPMGGIAAGLRGAHGEFAFVVACDMPFLDPGVPELLFERAAGHDAAVPRLDDEWFQTTQAVYRSEPMADACEAALEHGDRKIIDALFDLDYVVVPGEHLADRASLDSFENVNTETEFAAAAERLQKE